MEIAPLAELVKRLTLNQKIPGPSPVGCTEAVVKWLNTVEESESATMDEPTILTSARRGKSRGFESRLPMQYGNVRADGSSSHCGCEGPRFESETSPTHFKHFNASTNVCYLFCIFIEKRNK